MPLPRKVEKQTREQISSKLPANVLAKHLRDTEYRIQREQNQTTKRLEAWWKNEQANNASREQPKQPTREQSSKNQELMAASLTLGIPINSSMHDIKQAYHSLAMQTHPDRSDDPDATAKFQKLLEAYDILSAHQRMSKNGGNKCRNRRTSHHRPKKTQTHRHTTHHRKTHRVRV